jgi:hypothetical protein
MPNVQDLWAKIVPKMWTNAKWESIDVLHKLFAQIQSGLIIANAKRNITGMDSIAPVGWLVLAGANSLNEKWGTQKIFLFER